MPLDEASKQFANKRDLGPLALGISVEEQRQREASALAPRLGLPGEDKLLVEDLTIPGPASAISLRTYRPDFGAEKPLSALLLIHGGGFVIGSLDSHDGLCRALAATVPCVVIAVNYRRAPEHPFPAAHEDCYAALQWVADSLGRLGAKSGHLATAGDSAGGNLAASVAYMAKERNGPKLALQVPIIPCFEARCVTGAEPRSTYKEFTQATTCLLSAEGANNMLDKFFARPADAQDPRYALLGADLAGVAPAFVSTAEVDPLRDEGHAYAEKLKSSGVPVRYKQYNGTCHGFIQQPLPQTYEAIQDVAAELQKAFGL